MALDPLHVDPSRVATYIRWSTEDQGEGTTLEVQREACTAYIVSQGWVVNAALVYVDDGHSGGSMDRPALNRLRAAVAAGEVDCVVVFKLDRLSRNVKDMVNLVCGEWEDRCFVKSAREPIDTTTHAGRMFFYTLTSFAEWERNVIRDRLFSGKLQRARDGHNPGLTPPYGYRRAGAGVLEVVPEEAALVQRIYQLYLSGLGARGVTWQLNSAGLVGRAGRPWAESTVKKILANPIYMGHLVYGRKAVTKTGGRVRRKEPLVVREGAFPAIIPAEEFQRVQALKRARPGFGRGGNGRTQTSAHLLTGILRCRCGHSFAGSSAGARIQYRYYHCLGYRDKGPAVCHCGRIRQDLLDTAVARALQQLYGGPRARERLLETMTADLRQQLAATRGALAQATATLAGLAEEGERLRRMLRKGEVTVAEYRDLMAGHHRELAELEARQGALRQQEGEAAGALADRSHLRSLCDRIDAWADLNLPQRKELVRQLAAAITAYRDMKAGTVELSLTWRWHNAAGPEVAPLTLQLRQGRNDWRQGAQSARRDRAGRFVSKG